MSRLLHDARRVLDRVQQCGRHVLRKEQFGHALLLPVGRQLRLQWPASHTSIFVCGTGIGLFALL
jgi:hypothetical protein